MGIFLDWARSGALAMHRLLGNARERRTVLTTVVGVAALLLGSSPVAPGDAPEPETGRRVVETVSLQGGRALVTQAQVGTLSYSDCRSGYTCIWSSSLYSGTLFQYSQPGTVIPLPDVTIGSYANRRAKRATFYETVGGGGSSVCAPPGTRNQAVAGWLLGARSLIQSSTTSSC